jgi:hypothetical protein
MLMMVYLFISTTPALAATLSNRWFIFSIYTTPALAATLSNIIDGVLFHLRYTDQ